MARETTAAYPNIASPRARRGADASGPAHRRQVPRYNLAMQQEVRRLAGGGGVGSDQGALGSHVNELRGLIGNRAVARVMRPQAPSSRDAPESGGAGLARDLRARIEGLSGISMGDVRVHADSPRPAKIQAHAYTAGSDIYLSRGQERHLPHEAWHAVQQKQGRVWPTAAAMPGRQPMNDDPALEREADRMGAKAATPGDASGTKAPSAELKVARAPRQDVIQGKWFRLSTILDKRDEEGVAAIRKTAESGDLSRAFWMVVYQYAELSESFKRLTAFAERSGEVAQAVDHVLWETFNDPKAHTAAEVMDLLEENEVIVDAADLLIEEDDREIEALVTEFGKLHIETFRSDVDDRKEEHSVYWGTAPSTATSDVIVASNPKPLQLVLAAKSWEGYPLSSALITQLSALRKIAKLALYAISGNAKRNITGARTKTKMDSFRMALIAIANVLRKLGGASHKATLLPLTDLSTSAKTIEGTHVVASPLSINSAKSGSSPKDGRLMTAIRARAGTDSKSYVQMHLLNDLVFGPGELWNLTPGPKQSNVDMERYVEDPLKRAVLGKGLVINFEATVTYANDPTTAALISIQQNPDKYRFQSIAFKAEQLEYDPTSLTWKKAGVQDADVQAIDGARVNWRYGGLAPLTPKPSIVDPATTWQELVAVGVQPTPAKRIVAFINANPTWRPTGADKQKQLAAAVKAWDRQSNLPNISSWKAIAVYWTV